MDLNNRKITNHTLLQYYYIIILEYVLEAKKLPSYCIP